MCRSHNLYPRTHTLKKQYHFVSKKGCFLDSGLWLGFVDVVATSFLTCKPLSSLMMWQQIRPDRVSALVYGVTTVPDIALSLFLKLFGFPFVSRKPFFPCCSSRSHNSNCTFASRGRLQHGGHFGEHSARYQISVNCVNSEESLWTLRLCLGQLTPWMTLLFGFAHFWAISQRFVILLIPAYICILPGEIFTLQMFAS